MTIWWRGRRELEYFLTSKVSNNFVSEGESTDLQDLLKRRYDIYWFNPTY